MNSFILSIVNSLGWFLKFDMLLGQLQPDGCRKPGLIDKFGGDSQKVIEAVAIDSENKGMLEDAVQLYDLAKACVFFKIIIFLIRCYCFWKAYIFYSNMKKF